MKKSTLALAFIAVALATSLYAQARSQCMATTKDGNRCQNLAVPNGFYCHVHNK